MNVAFQYTPGAAFDEVVGWELEDDPVELANLTERDTGVPGVIYVSTRQGRHGPRVKWYPRRGGSDQPFLTITLEEPPRVLNHGVAPRDASGAVAAAEWTALNRAALLSFWAEGTSLAFDEIVVFVRGLERLP